jgi:putative Mg2+ transporter-C (MgtC) family protein
VNPIVTNPWTETVLRLAVAALLGGLVGLDRETSGKPAGLRTNMLICVGAALLTELSIAVARSWDPPGPAIADPGRIAAQIVSGVGFLGAGTIIQSRHGIRGLTTAASLWVVAAIGMAAGAGAFFLAAAATGIVIITLWLLPRVEEKLAPHERSERSLRVGINAGGPGVSDLENRIRATGLRITSLQVERQAEGGLTIVVDAHGKAAQWQAALLMLTAADDVLRVSLE